MILKPANQTPLTALALAELAVRAGVPEGVLSVLTGNSKQISARPCPASRPPLLDLRCTTAGKGGCPALAESGCRREPWRSGLCFAPPFISIETAGDLLINFYTEVVDHQMLNRMQCHQTHETLL